MSDTVIKIRNVSKRYQLGALGYGTLHKDLTSFLARLRGKDDPNSFVVGDDPRIKSGGEFWALQDINLDVQRGKVLGIIGKNGAGKSTLLKLLARITAPTSGQISIKGRIASMLEVGTGFHPELTGRENIFLNGAIMGMTPAEIRAKFDEIVQFSGIEQFVDTPVKRYSSGMYVRLAFAIGAHLEPEILLVDEVLAVGDVAFQKKCLNKMSDVTTEQGRTVLFVSHNMSAVEMLCQEVALIKDGRIDFVGSPQAAVDRYQKDFGGDGEYSDLERKRKIRDLSRKVEFVSLYFKDGKSIFGATEAIKFNVKAHAKSAVKNVRISLTLFSFLGQAVGSSFSDGVMAFASDETREFSVAIPDHRLAPGKYYIASALGEGNNRDGHVDYDIVFDVLEFDVLPLEGDGGGVSQWPSSWGNVVLPKLEVLL